MRTELNSIIQQLFKYPDLEKLPLDEIRDFVTKYPYATAGRFILDQKYRALNQLEPGEMTASTLYFNNPLWLEFLRTRLNERSDPRFEIPELTTEEITNPDSNQEKDRIESEILADNQIVEPDVQSADYPLIDESLPENEPKSVEAETGHVNQPQIEKEPEIIQDTLTEDLVKGTEEISAHRDPDEKTGESLITDEMVEKTKDISAGTDDVEKKPELESNNKVQHAPMVFEPYHSVDYFASQGIRLQAADLGKDRLGQQLKSFTEWIKSMKRLPEAEKHKSFDQFAEQSITRIAQVSLEEKEIHTEAMAEVWVKQGNKDKARSIYEKLSLQNPSKSAYFAAKIEHLNTF